MTTVDEPGLLAAPPHHQPHLVQVATGGAATRRRGWRVPTPVRWLYAPLLLLLVWQLACSSGLLSPGLFPAPIDVATAGAQLVSDGELQSNLLSSLHRVLLGLGAGVGLGVVLAVCAGLVRRGQDVIDSGIQIVKAVPHFALVPLLIMWMGIGEEPKIVLIALGSGLPVYVNTYSAIRGVDAQLVEVAHTLGVSRTSLVLNVVLPGSLPGFLVGLRLGLAGAWLSLIFAETINTQSGIGFLMTQAQQQFQLDVMVLILVLYALIGLLSYSLVRFLERRLLVWRRGFDGV